MFIKFDFYSQLSHLYLSIVQAYMCAVIIMQVSSRSPTPPMKNRVQLVTPRELHILAKLQISFVTDTWAMGTTHEQACTSHPVSMDKSWNLPHFHKNLSCTAKPVITNIHCENTHTIKNNNKMHPAGPLLKFLDPPC